MTKSCMNCADYIVCYGLDEITEDKGKNCPDWHPDINTFTEEIENLIRSTHSTQNFFKSFRS